jgi:hypothetical protein
MKRTNKLERLYLTSLVFAAKASERLKGAPLGQAPVLPINIRVVLKGLPEMNALAYLVRSSVTEKKE